jgi:DNA polymerase III subunit epsilon
MINNYVALDFETSYGHIPCSIGIIEFNDGIPVNEYYSLIKPIDLKFNPINSRINGIYLEDVCFEREFDEIWLEIEHFFIDKLIVAHNASTDIAILEKTLDYYRIHKPNYTFHCTLSLAKNKLELDNYKLSTLAKYFKIEQNNYHNALEDAYVCGCIFSNFIKEKNFLNNNFSVNKSIEQKRNRSFFNNNLVQKCNVNFSILDDKKYTIEGKTFVVSGVFQTFSRDDLKKAIEDNGGKVGSSISSKTDFVVAGDNMGPAKLDKANQLKIPIITEFDFSKMIQNE